MSVHSATAGISEQAAVDLAKRMEVWRLKHELRILRDATPVCHLCGIDQMLHGDDPTTDACIKNLKAELTRYRYTSRYKEAA